ncbi:MAG TPA: Clp protease N-terminal domain-containing protein, partial [Streptosporangiaceae bacterium]
MFERFSDDARAVVVQAQEHARGLGHRYIGCEHLLLAVASTGEPASAVLREQGVTPEAVKAEIVRFVGRGPSAELFNAADQNALASIGIDLDAVRARIEEVFGPGAFTRAMPDACRSRRPAWRKGSPAQLLRRRRRCRSGRTVAVPQAAGAYPAGHIPFTPRAKNSLEHSWHEAKARHNNYIGVEHLTLALVAMTEGAVPPILSALGASQATLRAAIL